MKSKLTTYCCIDKTCAWKEESHKLRDGIKCHNCNESVMIGVDLARSDDRTCYHKRSKQHH